MACLFYCVFIRDMTTTTCTYDERKAEINEFMEHGMAFSVGNRLTWVTLFAALAEAERMEEKVTRFAQLDQSACRTTLSGDWAAAPAYTGDWRSYRLTCVKCRGWMGICAPVDDVVAVLLGRRQPTPEHTH